MKDRSQIVVGDALSVLRRISDNYIDCCVTSPPYFGLRDYGVDGQLGLEESPEEYISKMVEIFREVRRTLRPDGTLWLNLGEQLRRKRQRENGRRQPQQRPLKIQRLFQHSRREAQREQRR